MMAIQQQKMSVAHFTAAALFEQQTSDIRGVKRQQRGRRSFSSGTIALDKLRRTPSKWWRLRENGSDARERDGNVKVSAPGKQAERSPEHETNSSALCCQDNNVYIDLQWPVNPHQSKDQVNQMLIFFPNRVLHGWINIVGDLSLLTFNDDIDHCSYDRPIHKMLASSLKKKKKQ